MTRLSLVPALTVLLATGPALAHHGTAAVGVAGAEGPGAALETTSPLPLASGAFHVLAKSEYVSFRHYDFADPGNKDASSFNMLGVGYGLRPWLSLWAFQPYNLKVADDLGTSSGFGDTQLMLAASFKWDEGFRLVPERESLDELSDWHFSAWLASTLPVGPTEERGRGRVFFGPDMQTGFGKPSPSVGLAVAKQVGEDFTWLADASYQHFFEHEYSYTTYRFGGETRLNTALAWRVLGAGGLRADLVAELNGLHLGRDRERNEEGAMETLTASGGAILYAGGGIRLSYGPLVAGLGIRRAVLTRLNEADEQQGSEGRENFRASFSLGFSGALD